MSPAVRDADEAWLATLTVLYVEDDELTRTQLARFLRRRVGRLVEASDGADGLERFRAERPDFVITDVEMPKMGGLAMSEAIRRVDPTIPIVVITAFEEVGYLRRSIDAGVDTFVTKPVDVDKLEGVLTALAHRLRAETLVARERERELSIREARKREALGMLAAGMAHDFNNLLAVVLANLDLAGSSVIPGTEASELLDEAMDATRQAVELSRYLLALSDNMFVELRDVPLSSTLRSALAMPGSELRVNLPAELPRVPHDPEILGRAFEQIALNAHEAMGGSGVLSVAGELRQLVDGEVPPLVAGEYLKLTFLDSGPGIAPDIHPFQGAT